MILESVFSLLLDLIKSFLDVINISSGSLPAWSNNFLNLLLKCLAFFPFEIWSVLIADILLWVGIHFAWAVIEWIYIKIPGVN